MSGFTVIKRGDVIIEHYSTSSQIKIIINSKVQTDFGEHEEVIEKWLWLDYKTFDELKDAIKETDQ